MPAELEIRGFRETSFLDWDGKVVSVVYVPHCNFRCPFCHNSVLLESPDKLDLVPFEKIEKYLLEHKDFIDGICLTGGEPAVHKNKGLLEFLRRIKELGMAVKFDTNGTDPDLLKKALGEKLIDYIAMDLKGPLDERYYRSSGIRAGLESVKNSIKVIMESGLSYEFRTTVVPGLHDEKDIEDIARCIAGAEKFVLQQFVPKNTLAPAFAKIKAYEKEQLEKMAEISKKHVRNTAIRGI